MKVVTQSARTKEEAIRLALAELECTEAEAEIVVLEEASKGLFGLLGAREAKVRVTKVEMTDGNKSMAAKKTMAPKRPLTNAQSSDDKLSVFLVDVTSLMGVPAEVERSETEECIQYVLTGEHMGTLIGRRGDTLDALQYLANIVSNKSREADRKRIILDAEGYRGRREETLTRLAKRLAARVKRTGHKVVLEPMSPLERRLIHTALQEDPDVKTLSEGEEPYRRLVISPVNGVAHSYSSERKIGEKNDKNDKIDKNEKIDKPKTAATPILTYTPEKRFTERPPKRTYTNIEDVDVRSDSQGDGKSTLW